MGSHRVLAIGNADPTGFGGVQADMRSVAGAGGIGNFIITAITSPWSDGFKVAQSFSGKEVRAQFTSLDAGPLGAIKTGLLPTEDVVAVVAAEIRARPGVPVVAAPILPRTPGGFKVPGRALLAFCDHVLPLCRVLAVGRPEAIDLLGEDRDPAGLVQGLREMGPEWVILTNEPDGDVRQDLLSNGVRWFAVGGPAGVVGLGDESLHASALATALAAGSSVPEAASLARQLTVRERIRMAADDGGMEGQE